MTRLDILRNKMKDKGIDALIINDVNNIRYLSLFSFEDGYLFITTSSAHLITDFRYYEMALKDASDQFTVVCPKSRKDYLSEIISAENIRTIGFEGACVSYSLYNSYRNNFEVSELVDIGDMINEMRSVKDQTEIDSMQRAQDITDAAFSSLLKVINTEMTEIEVAAELEYYMKKMGSDGFAFGTIAVSGDASALPHGTPRNVKLKKGFLTLDFGAKFNGYCSDMTRTIVIGKADEDIKKVYNTVLSAQLEAIEYLKVGRDCFMADKVARDIIDKDYSGTFGHSLGHSVGLECHETPSLSPKANGKTLTIGNVVTVEPGIYLFGKYGCRIEDMVSITETGIYNFTHSTKELIEIY